MATNNKLMQLKTINLRTQIQNLRLLKHHQNMNDIDLINNQDDDNDDIDIIGGDDYDDGDDNGQSDNNEIKELTWISWFCNQKGNDIFCEVEKSFILDNFNLYGISRVIDNYSKTLEIILDRKILSDKNNIQKYLLIPSKWRNKMAQHLYGIIHSRYVLSVEGLQNLAEKYQNGDYGKCSRVHCDGVNLIPVGETDQLTKSTVKMYCPKCCDIYEPKSSRYHCIDGAYFGTSLPHSFFMTYPILRPINNDGKFEKKFQPKLYGFKIHSFAYDYQSNQAKQFQNRNLPESGDYFDQ